MGQRLILSDNLHDPGNPLVLDGRSGVGRGQRRLQAAREQAASGGLVTLHGSHRGMLLVALLDQPWG